MAQVGEIVARFRAETSDYINKIEAAKAKNTELAKSLLATAGSADRAIASLQIAKQKNALGDFGLDPRQVSGVIAQIRNLDREMRKTGEGADAMAKGMNDAGRKANAIGDIFDAGSLAGSGNILHAYEKFQKGLADLTSGEGLSGGLKLALVATAINLVGQALKKSTDEALKLKKEFQEGKISAGELTEKLIASIPIYGNIWAAGKNIRELIGLENRDYEEQVKLQLRLVEIGKETIKVRQQLTEQAEKRATEVKTIAEENAAKILELAGAKTQAAELRLRSAAAADSKSHIDAIEKERKATEEAANARLSLGDKETKSLLEQRSAAQKAVDEAKQKLLSTPTTITIADISVGSGAASSVPNTQGIADAKQAVTDAETSLNLIKSQVAGVNKTITEANANAAKAVADFAPERAKALELDLDKLLGDQTAIEKDAIEFGKTIVKNIQDQFKGSWLEQQLKAAMEAAKKQAKVDADKIAKAPQLKKDLEDDLIKLQRDRKSLDLDPRDVYKLPSINELRGGQNLYAPPSRVDEKQLEKLIQINEGIQKIKDKGIEGGVVLEEIEF